MGKSGFPALDEEWRDYALCRSHSTLPASAWTSDPPERANRARKELYWARRRMAAAACLACPVQWDCIAYAERTNDVWNVAGADPVDRLEFRRAMRDRDMDLAFESMRIEGIPVQHGLEVFMRHQLTTSNIVVRSAHGSESDVAGSARSGQR